MSHAYLSSRRAICQAALVLTAALLLPGCGGSGGSATTSTTGGASTGDDATTRSVDTTVGGTTLKVTFSVPQSAYSAGTSIPMTLTITNTGSTTYTYTRCGLSAYADATMAATNTIVWTSIYGHVIPQACESNVTLAPGQSVSDMLTWDQTLNGGGAASPGVYTLSFSSSRLSDVTIPTIDITVAAR